MGCVEVRHVSFAYGGASPLLCDLDFCVPDGSFFSILGPSGGGKTTLLRLLAGLLRPCAGSVVCAGREVLAPGRDRAIVFQQGGLFPWLTALGNVAFAASKTHPGMSRKECRSLASSMLDRVGLSQDMNKWPVQLSGGMRQRVSIARALAMETQVLLMDEPFSALDYKNRCLLQDLLGELWLASHKTVIFVTHDIDEALLLSDSILFLDGTRNMPAMAVPYPQPRARSLLTTTAFCELRRHFIALFNREHNPLGISADQLLSLRDQASGQGIQSGEE